jgi:light-regulated signal transduction histidine kinase (bacteriophytochrome)
MSASSNPVLPDQQISSRTGTSDYQQLLEAVIGSAPFPISIVEGSDLRYILANPAMISTLQSAESPVLGCNSEQLYSSDIARKRTRLLRQVHETAKPQHLREVYAPAGPENREAWWNIDLVPVLNDQGTVSRIIILEQEITDLVLERQQLERSNRELQEFAFIAAHDLKEPLRKIDAFGEMLNNNQNMTEQQRDYLDRMRSAAIRMQNMVEELLKLSRLTTQPRTFVRVNLDQVASEVISDLDVQINQASGTVEVEPLPTVIGDLLLVRQLFQNLIGNALKFHTPGVPPRIKVYAQLLPENAVQVSVEDNGIGFNMEDAERIFQPFQRLLSRNQYEGNGMGLAICKKIVERHGGTITAVSKLGEGSTFRVTLPLGYIQQPNRR